VHDAIKTTTDNIDTLTGQRTEAGDASVDEALAAEKDALERLKGRIRVRNHCLLAGSLTILIAVLISWVGLFDWAGLDTKVETYTLGLRDLVAGGAQGLDERIVTVVIDRESEQALGKPFDRSWRHEHARLLDELSGAGARVVAFDLHFKEPSPEADAALSGALKRARERGTAVIIGFADVAGGVPVVAASLREAVEGFGVVCLGSREGYGMLLPLLVTQEAGDVPPFPSLALRAYLAFRDGWDRVWMDKDSRSVWWWPRGGQEPAKIPFSRVDNVRSAQPECGTIGPGDKVAQLILDPTPLGELRTGAHHYAYHEVALGRLTPARRDGLAGKIVLVGRGATRDVDDVHTVQPGFAGENRYGWELHADALNTLLTGTAIRPLGVWVQSGIMTVMAFIGAFLNYFIPPRYRRGQRLLLAAVSVCYLAIALWLCVRHGLLVNTLYHLVALWVAYWVAKRVKGGLPHVV
jgi:CHASE2 domain-containing sensor protein